MSNKTVIGLHGYDSQGIYEICCHLTEKYGHKIIHDIHDSVDNSVFPDVMNENDALYIRDVGGIVIRVVDPKHSKPDSHYELPSEYIDVEITNNGSIEELHTEIDYFIQTGRGED